MKDTKLLTDIELRAHWFRTRQSSYTVAEGTYVTQSARDFLKEHGIELHFAAPKAAFSPMTVTPVPVEGGKARYVDFATGRPLSEKAEHMTHLRGNLLVPKTHPRIAFRGKLDSLMAQMMGVQLMAAEAGREPVVQALEELLAFVRSILGAEVKGEPLEEIRLLGMDSQQLREVSHHVKEHIGIPHPVPSYRMGRLCVALNRLRTQVREVELSAARAFAPDGPEGRADLIEGLNRLSSCVYILFCRAAAGSYDEVK